MNFTSELEAKIQKILGTISPIKLGSLKFCSPLLLAPIAGITSTPFRLLMESLGAGGTVSELISCHGINYKNIKTVEMLKVHPKEKNTGIQLFGEDILALSRAADFAQEFGAKFIDINMGCPVKKVVSKGAGSAMMENPTKLVPLFRALKKILKIPLTIKIRTGRDQFSRNAGEIVQIAKDEGVEFVAIHGRTKAQGYSGAADWDFIENLAQIATLPIVGNGDLHEPATVIERLGKTNCQALMLGRGPLKNPFIFLESLSETPVRFTPLDYLEVIKQLAKQMENFYDREHFIVTKMKKHIVWFATGYPSVSTFRGRIFTLQTLKELIDYSSEFFEQVSSNCQRQ